MFGLFKKKPMINIHFNDGAVVENLTQKDEYQISFKDGDDIVHQGKINAKQWIKAFRSYYTPWRIECYHRNKLKHQYEFDSREKRIRVNIDSKSLGDTLAWIGQISAFSEKHAESQVFVSHFWPSLIDINLYERLTFIPPNEILDDCYATYNLGFYFDDVKNKHPVDPRLQPLGKVAADILGIEYQERRPLWGEFAPINKNQERYVCIATASTAECKHWLYATGWQTVVDHVRSKGFQIKVIQKEPTTLKNIVDCSGDRDINQRIDEVRQCEFVIGLGSGISWMGWALGKPVVLISGFSKPYAEFQDNCIRVINKDVCHGCWNNPEHIFDRNDWFWCPEHKDTNRQFECSKSISAKMVTDAIDHLIQSLDQNREL